MAKSFSRFLEKFRRITSGSSDYMPELDGLRFVALVWVVVLMHLPNIINVNIYNEQLITSSFIAKMILEGGNGLCFFFMISGFILALPFVKEKIYHQKKVPLRKYYIRRLFRIEPPYFAALLIAFFLLITIGDYTFSNLADNLLASIFYLHNWIYQEHSAVLGVAWSLEVETRFYLLAPLLAFVYLIKNPWLRRGIMAAVAIAGCLKQYFDLWNPASPFINFFCFFVIGMLIADLYAAKWKLIPQSRYCQWFGIILFIGMHFIFSADAWYLYLAKTTALAVFFYIAITNPWWRKLLSIQWIAIIGGMCYSIYLLHLIIMSGLTKVLVEFRIENKILGLFIYGAIMLFVVLVCCMIFYRLIEQPCMRSNWWRRRKL